MDMIMINSETVNDLKKVMSDQGITQNSLRLGVNMGWGGSSFYLALDESNENDIIQETEGLQFIVSKMLYQLYQGFTVQSINDGSQVMLKITPKVPDDSGGGCAGCTSCW